MKRIKEVDVAIQVLLITGSVLYGFITADFHFIFGYLLVGGWQLLSCLFHAVTRYPYLPSPARRTYLRTLGWTVGIGGLLSIGGGLVFFLFALLFVSPFYAVWYTCVCSEEAAQLKRRAFIQFR